MQLTVLFLMQEDQVLLAMKKRGFGEGKWNGVGGKVEEHESVEAAMIREAQEEINVTPSTYKKVAELTFEEMHIGTRKHMYVTVFTCTAWKDDPTESEEMAPRWFKKDDLPYASMWSDDIHWLPLILEGKKVIAEFVLDDNNAVVKQNVTEVMEFQNSN